MAVCYQGDCGRRPNVCQLPGVPIRVLSLLLLLFFFCTHTKKDWRSQSGHLLFCFFLLPLLKRLLSLCVLYVVTLKQQQQEFQRSRRDRYMKRACRNKRKRRKKEGTLELSLRPLKPINGWNLEKIFIYPPGGYDQMFSLIRRKVVENPLSTSISIIIKWSTNSLCSVAPVSPGVTISRPQVLLLLLLPRWFHFSFAAGTLQFWHTFCLSLWRQCGSYFFFLVARGHF